jgi:hypothetical protein
MQAMVGLAVVGFAVGSFDGCTEGALLNVGLVEGCSLTVGEFVGLAGLAEGTADGLGEGAALPVGWLLAVGA